MPWAGRVACHAPESALWPARPRHTTGLECAHAGHVLLGMRSKSTAPPRQVVGGDIVPAVAHVVVLEDDPRLGRLVLRFFERRACGALRIAHCVDPSSFRAYVRSLVGGALPLLMVMSDYTHPGETNGIEDLKFVRDAPCDLAAGAVRLSAANLVLQTGSEPPDAEATLRLMAAHLLSKPWLMEDFVAVFDSGLRRLIEGLEAELEAGPTAGPIQGPLTWGPVEQVRRSLSGLRCLERTIAERAAKVGSPS